MIGGAAITPLTPTTRRSVGNILSARAGSLTVTGAEDFAYFAQAVPGLFIGLGITPEGTAPIPNHSPPFVADERALPIGVRALAYLAVDYMTGDTRAPQDDVNAARRER